MFALYLYQNSFNSILLCRRKCVFIVKLNTSNVNKIALRIYTTALKHTHINTHTRYKCLKKARANSANGKDGIINVPNIDRTVVDLTVFTTNTHSDGSGSDSSSSSYEPFCRCIDSEKESDLAQKRMRVFISMAFYVSFVVPSQYSASINFHLTRKTFPSSVEQCSAVKIKATRKYADDKNRGGNRNERTNACL